jgi:hypothetical protein
LKFEFDFILVYPQKKTVRTNLSITKDQPLSGKTAGEKIWIPVCTGMTTADMCLNSPIDLRYPS